MMIRQRKNATESLLPIHTRGPETSLFLQNKQLRSRKRSKSNNTCTKILIIIVLIISFTFIFAGHTHKDTDNHVLLRKKKRHNKIHKSNNAHEIKIDHPQTHRSHKSVDRVVSTNEKAFINSTGEKKIVLCSDNKTQGVLNDDYCDCPDGSDEPNTSACSHILVQKALFPCDDGTISIFTSRVNDGVKDCADGSDERVMEKI